MTQRRLCYTLKHTLFCFSRKLSAKGKAARRGVRGSKSETRDSHLVIQRMIKPLQPVSKTIPFQEGNKDIAAFITWNPLTGNTGMSVEQRLQAGAKGCNKKAKDGRGALVDYTVWFSGNVNLLGARKASTFVLQAYYECCCDQ